MTVDIKDIQNKINKLAKKLVTLDYDTQQAEILNIRMHIWSLIVAAGHEYVITDRYGNDWYKFRLFNNLVAPYETLEKTLEENLRIYKNSYKEKELRGKWVYNPDRGDFIITIIKKTKSRIGKNDIWLKGYLQTEESTDSDGISKGVTKDYKDPADYIAEVENRLYNLQRVEYIANMIICQSWVEQGRENKQHFEGFFTHDRVTEERSSDGVYITDEYSDIIFPALSIQLLEYLMHGSFSRMRDLVLNRIREGINLAQCVQNVGDCFSMSSPKYYHVKYKQWLASIEPK